MQVFSNLQMLSIQQILRWVWLAWSVYWFASAFGTRRTVRREPFVQRMSTIAVMVLAVGLLGLVDERFGFLGQRFVPDTETVRRCGLALTVAGLAFTVWARIHLGQFWSARVGLKEGHELIQSDLMRGYATRFIRGSWWR